MSVEQGSILYMQDHMENNEVSTPEILPENRVRILIPRNPEFAHYNAAVLKSGENPDNFLILIREVPLANVKAGIPDKGNMVVYLSTPEKVERLAELNLNKKEIDGLEDPRCFQSGIIQIDDQGEYEEVIFGLTAIRASDNHPVAATLKGKIRNGNLFIDQESLEVFLDDEGKNMTPINLTQFLLRRAGSRHTLDLVEKSIENGKNKLKTVKTLQFPEKPWCEWSIGTQAQILPGGMLPVHGVNKISLGIDPKTRRGVDGYTYNLSLVQVDENLNVTKVADKALFTRESFKKILPMGKELDDNKDVIYCCGYSVRGNTVAFVINIGDLMTVEVSKTLSELQEMLDKSSPIGLEQMPDRLAA